MAETAKAPEGSPPVRNPESTGRLVKRVEALFILALPVVAAAYLWEGSRIRTAGTQVVQLSPRVFPMIIGALMLVASIGVAVQYWRQNLSPAGPQGAVAQSERTATGYEGEEAEGEGETDIDSWKDVGVSLGALTVFIVAFEPVGFLISASCLVAFLATYFDRSGWIKNVVIGVVFAAALYYLFGSLLGVTLPPGILG